MDPELAARLDKLECQLAYMEHQVEQLNEVVTEQGKSVERLKALVRRQTETIEGMELERIRNTNIPPPHYQA